MNIKLDDKDLLMQSDVINFFKNLYEDRQFLKVFNNPGENWGKEHRLEIRCFLCPLDRENEFLEDLELGSDDCDMKLYYNCDQDKVQYFHYFKNNAIQPLIINRWFSTIQKREYEISEEFRLLFNLFYESKSLKYIEYDERECKTEDVIKIAKGDDGTAIEVDRTRLKTFLGLKRMSLIVHFYSLRFSNLPIDDIPKENLSNEDRCDTFSSKLWIGQNTISNGYSLMSSLDGRKVISGFTEDVICENQRKKNEKKYESFIIKKDENGNDIEYECDYKKLEENERYNTGEPTVCTPVYFKREVLKKYYDNTQLYDVNHNSIKLCGQSHMQVDNDHEDYIIGFLGYIGLNLSYNEQKHWKQYNFYPEGKLSKSAVKTFVNGKFSDPKAADFLFKKRFCEFNRNWFVKLGWFLFEPLHEDDEYNLKSFRLPLVEDQSEIDKQFFALQKLVIEYLNEKEIRKQGIKIEKDDKGIDKLEKYLDKERVPDYKDSIIILRYIQDYRSKSSHRKGSGFSALNRKLDLDNQTSYQVMSEILYKLIAFLEKLSSHFLLK
jgi:hypothetical protein